MKTLALAVFAFIISTSVAFAHAPVLTIDPVGALEFASFPQVEEVTGVITHNPLSAIQNLTLQVNGEIESVIALPYPESTATTSSFALPWNITAPGTYTLMVSARHGTTGATGTSTEEVVTVTETVVVPPPEEEEDEDDDEEPPVVIMECPAAPAIAAAYLKELGMKAGGKGRPNVISHVARHMGPQKRFNGVDACATSAYESAVKAFVDGLVG